MLPQDPKIVLVYHGIGVLLRVKNPDDDVGARNETFG